MRTQRRGVMLIAALVLGVAALVSTPSYAEWTSQSEARRDYKHRPHFYLGGRGVGLFEVYQNTDFGDGYLGNGGGFGLFAGVRMSSFVALEFNWASTWHTQRFGSRIAEDLVNDFHLMTFTGDLNFYFPMPSFAEPYIFIGGGYGLLGANYANDNPFDFSYVFSRGPTWEGGLGVDFWLTPLLSLGARVYYRGVYLSHPEFRGGELLSSDRDIVTLVGVDGGLTLHF